MSADPAGWDVVVVGAGPAGAAAALAVRRLAPERSVLLLDRSDFPRDKACGDGVAPQVLDLLAPYGASGLLDDRTPVRRLRLAHGHQEVSRCMDRPAWVVPRSVLDARLVGAAVDAGAVLRRHLVRRVVGGGEGPVLDGRFRARVLVGADGAHSVVRGHLGLPRPATALAIRGYAPTPSGRVGEQVIAFGDGRQPSYAWSFDRGDGQANVGYGELLLASRPPPSRALLLEQLERLLPGSTAGAGAWRGHHLPLSSWTWRQPAGAVLLAGDAAALVNPMTGEGIHYAVLTGLLAGRAAVASLAEDRPEAAGALLRRSTQAALGRHLRHSALAARLSRSGPVLDAGIEAARGSQRVFDDLVHLGLADGSLTSRVVGALGRVALGGLPGRVGLGAAR